MYLTAAAAEHLGWMHFSVYLQPKICSCIGKGRWDSRSKIACCSYLSALFYQESVKWLCNYKVVVGKRHSVTCKFCKYNCVYYRLHLPFFWKSKKDKKNLNFSTMPFYMYIATKRRFEYLNVWNATWSQSLLKIRKKNTNACTQHSGVFCFKVTSLARLFSRSQALQAPLI